MDVVICAIAKNENAYLYEWAAYHLSLGFRSIHIYDNNEIDGENVADVFVGTEIENRIIVHDVRGMKYMQKIVYQECYDKEKFDYCAFIDIDEFITLEDEQNIQGFLEPLKGWEAVHLNWKCYGDNGLVMLDARPIQERFLHPWKKDIYYSAYPHRENEHIKSIIHSGLKIDWTSGEDSNPHTPKGLKRVCNAVGHHLDNTPFAPICYAKAYIRHYITKTIAEYAIKVDRQCADCDALQYTFTKFFRVNFPSPCKLFWLHKHFPDVSLIECIREHIKAIWVNKNLPGYRYIKSYSHHD